MARTERYARAFLDLGVPLHALLERLAPGGTVAGAQAAAGPRAGGAYARDLLDALQQERSARGSRGSDIVLPPSSGTGASIDSLTDRELEVLRLLSRGLSNKGIAERLVVAPSTVKQHLKNIYSKLDVHSRTQAVARGRELGLL